MTDPTTFVLLNLTLIVMIPAVLIGVRLAGVRPAGSVLSVTGRFRWERLWRAVLVATPFYVVFLAVSLLVEPDAGSGFEAGGWLVLGLVLLLTPLQAAAEELAITGPAGSDDRCLAAPPAVGDRPADPPVRDRPRLQARPASSTSGSSRCAPASWRGVLEGWRRRSPSHVVNNVLVLALGALGFIDVNDQSVTWVATTFGCALTIVVTAAILRTETRTSVAVSAPASLVGTGRAGRREQAAGSWPAPSEITDRR